MPDTAHRTRQPAGIRTGGQYATEPKIETPVTLGVAPTTVLADIDALNAITTQLGTAAEWNTGDDLTAIAETIAHTGRPHPGESSEDYRKLLEAWKRANPVPATTGPPAADWVALNTVATYLGEAEDWRAWHLEAVADLVKSTGRPHPGKSRTLREFEQEMAAFRRDRGLIVDSPAGTRQVAEEAGLPVVHEVLTAVAARGTLEQAQFDTVTPEDVKRWHEELLAPAADRMAKVIADMPPGEGNAWIADEDEAWEHLSDAARGAGAPAAAELIWLRYETEDLYEDDIAEVTPDVVADLYQTHLGPAVEAIEAQLLTR